MISSFRKLSKSWVAPIIVGLIALSFVIVGTTDFLGGGSSNGPVVKAGSREISQLDYRRIVDQRVEAFREQSGQAITMQDLVDQGGHLQILEGIAESEGFLAWAWRSGLRPGAELIAAQIREFPVFFNQVTGQFDPQQYASTLAQQNVTEADFEAEIRDQLAANHYGAAIYAGLRLPRIYGAVLAGQSLHTRDGSWFVVTPAMAGQAEPPTEEQLTAYLNENAEQLRRPEFRTISLVVFSPASEADLPPITDEQIQERFEFRRESLSQAETRTFTTLTAADEETAAAIAQGLRGGQSPAAVAAANDVQPVEYENRARSAVTDPAIAAAAFGAEEGAVVGPVRSGLGRTVILVESVTAGQAATLASSREAIVQELREEAMRGQTYDAVERYEQARQDGASLAEAVEAAGARVIDLPPFTEDGRLPNGQPLNAPEPVLRSAYAQDEGGESDVIDAGQGQYFVVRVNEVTPAAMPSLDDVREPLVQNWLQRENARRLAALADELAGRVRGGESIAEVAASVNAELVTRTGVQQNEETQTQVGQGVMRGLFSQGVEQVFSGQQDGQSFVVGRVDRIRAPVAALAAPRAEQIRPQMSMQAAEALGDGARAAAADQMNVRTWPDRALNALGIAPSQAPAAPVAEEE
ncbi:SurA N-terminal domain-containing protein [Brevundimonas sp. BAL450]|uniref:peptidylprolyl isomerase n=1 Tax=Brevundimonas sp. BAL450 TaxID=1708162 RepID=UPI0018C986D2|nr:peptidylprolyl isomerase [Brevundimonas sp. BAL450]MBG7615733.1 SurA N-terminal domain-containing protein [Brevundimonas sp. BAL450]